MLLKTADPNHLTIYKLRRCFEWKHRYFQLDIYEEPCNPCCRGLIILSTHCLDPASEKNDGSTSPIIMAEQTSNFLPDFIEIEKEITHDENYSMFNLSMKKQKRKTSK
jgi:hypothetical protein